MVILDSDHTRDHVINELRLYSGLVQQGDYLIVQDTNASSYLRDLHGHKLPGPAEAVARFISEDPRFIQDRTRERLLHTMHPGGYLRRKRCNIARPRPDSG